jgi:hypothetical protein
MMSLSSSKVLITSGCSFSAPWGDETTNTWVKYFQKKYKFELYSHSGMGAAGNEMITQRLMYSINNALQKGYTDITLAVMWSEHHRNDVFTKDWSLDIDTDNGNIMFNNQIYTNIDKGANHNITSGFIRPGAFPQNEDYYRNEKQRNWLLNYYKFYNEEYSLLCTLKNVILIQSICKLNNIKCIMFVMRNIFEELPRYPQLNYLQKMVDWDKFIFFEEEYGLFEYTLVNDLKFWDNGFHPKYKAHKHFIDFFDDEIKKRL